MEDKERLVTKIIKTCVEFGVSIKFSDLNFFIASTLTGLAGQAVEWLLQFLCSGYRRISTAVRERNPENTIAGVICREIVAMGLELHEKIVETVMEIINLLRRLYNRGATFIASLGQKSLSATSSSSRRHE